MLIQGGDKAIAGAIAEGMMRAAEERLLEAAPLTGEQVEVVEAEIDRQRIQRALLRVAVGNTNTAEDYANMMTKARGDYGADVRKAGPLRAIGERLMQVYALVVLGFAAAYRAQDRVLMAGCADGATPPPLRATSPFRGGTGRR